MTCNWKLRRCTTHKTIVLNIATRKKLKNIYAHIYIYKNKIKWRHNEVGILWWCEMLKEKKENFKHLPNYAHKTQLSKIKKRRLTNKLWNENSNKCSWDDELEI